MNWSIQLKCCQKLFCIRETFHCENNLNVNVLHGLLFPRRKYSQCFKYLVCFHCTRRKQHFTIALHCNKTEPFQ